MKRRFIILAMITTMVLLVFVIGGLAKPLNLEEKINLEDIQVWNPCTEEMVELDATLHLSGRLLLDSAEGFHLKLHANSHLVGVGLTYDTEYIANATSNWQLNGKFLPFETTKVLTASLISQGKEPNLKLKARFHVTVNANGELTAYVGEFEVECTGEKS